LNLIDDARFILGMNGFYREHPATPMPMMLVGIHAMLLPTYIVVKD